MEQALLGLQLIILGSIYVAAFVGAITMRRSQSWTLVILLTIPFYFLVMSSGPGASARFRFPMVPFIAILAAFGLQRISNPKRCHPL